MKEFTLMDNTRPEKVYSSLYRYQAQERENHRFEFRLEMELIGARLRKLRLDKGYTMVSAAQALKIPKHRLYKMEHGTYVHFGLTDLYKLAELYGVSAFDILSVIPDANFDNIDIDKL